MKTKSNSNLPFVYHENASDTDAFRSRTDAYSFDNELNIFAVADAPLRILTRNCKNYPYDDIGKLASQTWCNSFVASAQSFIAGGDFGSDQFKASLLTANSAIRLLNQELDRKDNDVENYDIAECVGMGAVAYMGKLYYGGLEDCYVFLQDGETLKDLHSYDYKLMKSAKFLDRAGERGEFSDISDSLKEVLGENVWEAYWCNVLRNNTDVTDEDGKPIGWGCFTGEPQVEKFLYVAECKYKAGDHLLLLSDGMITAINNEKFIKYLFDEATPTFQSLKKARELVSEIYKDDRSEFSEKLLVYKKL